MDPAPRSAGLQRTPLGQHGRLEAAATRTAVERPEGWEDQKTRPKKKLERNRESSVLGKLTLCT